MNTNTFKPSLIAAVFLVCACSPSAEDQQTVIQELERKMKDQKQQQGYATSDSALTSEMIQSYIQYASKNPDDTNSAVYLFKAGNLAAQSGDFHVAEKSFQKLLEKYPNHADAPMALFLLAFTFENLKGDRKSAEECYRKFLKQYPSHPLAKDVRFSLENIGKSPEEILNEIEKKDSIPS